jgi:hypothetical protein
MRKFARFVKLESSDRRLLIRAAYWLAIARIMLVAIPFRRLSERLSSHCALDDLQLDPDRELLLKIGRAVAMAANSVPWRSDCFPQTIAARKLLERHGYGSTIHIGVARDEGEGLAAHAWLTCGDTVVTGGANLERYTELHRIAAK